MGGKLSNQPKGTKGQKCGKTVEASLASGRRELTAKRRKTKFAAQLSCDTAIALKRASPCLDKPVNTIDT